MTTTFGYCKKHKRTISDFCPHDEPEIEEEVKKFKERKGYT